MDRIAKAVRGFIRNEEGAALVEYGILIALIAVVAIVIVATLGGKISEKFSSVNARL